MQTQADVLGINVVLPQEKESVLLGSAISGAAAYYKDRGFKVNFFSRFRDIRIKDGSDRLVPNADFSDPSLF